jgi:hypothetical protein
MYHIFFNATSTQVMCDGSQLGDQDVFGSGVIMVARKIFDDGASPGSSLGDSMLCPTLSTNVVIQGTRYMMR